MCDRCVNSRGDRFLRNPSPPLCLARSPIGTIFVADQTDCDLTTIDLHAIQWPLDPLVPWPVSSLELKMMASDRPGRARRSTLGDGSEPSCGTEAELGGLQLPSKKKFCVSCVQVRFRIPGALVLFQPHGFKSVNVWLDAL